MSGRGGIGSGAGEEPTGPRSPEPPEDLERYADGLHAYALSLLGDAEAAADATVDALLVAAAARTALTDPTDPTRLRPWLYALVRAEALRRCRPGARPPLAVEAAELTRRHRLSPADVAAVLGHPAEDADRLATSVSDAPVGLGPLPAVAPADRQPAGGAAHRAAVPGWTQPAAAAGLPDPPRLSGRALVLTAASVVLVALAVLMALPGDGLAPPGTGPATPKLAAAGPPPRVRSEQQAPPTLSASLAAPPGRRPSAGPATRPGPAPDRGADRRPVPAGGTPRGSGRPDGADPPGVLDAGDHAAAPTTLTVDWAALPSAGCRRGWTAALSARPAGPRAGALLLVLASWSDGGGRRRAVPLRAAGPAWVGRLSGLPSGRPVVVTVSGATGDGMPVDPAVSRLAPAC